MEENDSDPGYQVFSTEEIAESALACDQAGESSSSDSEDEVVVRPIMSQVRDCIDTLIQNGDETNDRDIQGFYEHLRTLRELIIRQRYQRGKQLKLDSFFKSKPASTVSQPIRLDSPPLAPSLSPKPSTNSAQEATSSASEDLPGFFESE